MLEVGFGAGFSTIRIKESLSDSAKMKAIEIEPTLVEKSRERNPQVQIFQGSAYELPFEDNEFDLVA